MLTLSEMQHSTPEMLRELAQKATCRQYAIALEQMAHAMYTHGACRLKERDAHVERAKVAHKRAQEDEAGQVLRCKILRESLGQ